MRIGRREPTIHRSWSTIAESDGGLASRSGSPFQSQLAPTVTASSYDNANRLTSRTASGSGISPIWDNDGELTDDGTQTLTWNSRRQLTQVGSTVFSYDMVGRCRAVVRGGTSTNFVYDDWNEVQESRAAVPAPTCWPGSASTSATAGPR